MLGKLIVWVRVIYNGRYNANTEWLAGVDIKPSSKATSDCVPNGQIVFEYNTLIAWSHSKNDNHGPGSKAPSDVVP